MSRSNLNEGVSVLEPMKVFIRVRPEPAHAASNSSATSTPTTGGGTLSIIDDTTLQISGNGKFAKDKVYNFTEVFRETTTQDQIYAKVESLVADAVLGYNTAVFAYGAIASGKTYTMIGNKNDQGILPRTIRDLFAQTERIQAEDPSVYYFIEATYVEIYNNKFRNLLKADDTDRIDIHESANLGVFLTGNDLRLALTSADQAIAAIAAANTVRITRPRNKLSSSRGHGVLTFHIERRQIVDGKTKLSVGSLNIVDLAGIEKLTTSSASGNNPQHGELYIEAQSINSSLNGVGDVLSALAEESKQRRATMRKSVSNATSDLSAYMDSFGDDTSSVNGSTADEKKSAAPAKKAMHIPYLNSKLTHYLKEALGGNCRTTAIFTLIPGNDSNTSTVLMYAEWAMKVRHTVKLNVINTQESWTLEKDPEANKLKTNLDVRSKEAEEILRKKLIGLNLPPPPTMEQVVVSELAETASELAALRRSSLLRQESSRVAKSESVDAPPPAATPSEKSVSPAVDVVSPPQPPDNRDKELSDLRIQLAARTKEWEAERNSNLKLSATVEELKRQVPCKRCPELEKTIASLQEINRLSTINMSELNAKVVKLTDDVNKEHDLRSESESRGLMLESQLEACKKEIELLRGQLDLTDSLRTKDSQRVADLELTLANEEKTLAAEAKHLNEMQKQLNADEAQLKELLNKNSLLEKQLHLKDSELQKLNDAISSREAACSDCKGKLALLEKSLQDKETQLASLSAELNEKEASIAELRGKLSLLESQKADTSLLRDAYTAKAAATARAEIAESSLAKRDCDAKSLQSKLDLLTQQIEELNTQLESAQSDKEQLETKNSELHSQVIQLRTQLEEAESTDEEVDTETVEVEQTITETEVVGEDGEIEIRREIVETTRTTKVHDLHHHSSKVNLLVESSSSA